MTALVNWFDANGIMMLRTAVVLAVGWPLIRICESLARRSGAKKLAPQSLMLLTKSIRYGLGMVLAMTLLNQLGFNLSAIIGAAGIAGVAISFAAQTSLSNLISGMFLIAERPFQIGDAIQVGDTVGLVHSIDLLSVKLRTFDNRYIRIPNETLVKNQTTNITRFPIRRLDIDVGVAYKENLDHVIWVLKDIAEKNPYALDEPEPLVLFKGFGDSSLNLMLGVWFEKTEMLVLKNSILLEIKRRFDAEHIEFPFPHVSLYAGSATGSFPVHLTRGDSTAAPAQSPSQQGTS
jgi:small-conductance mechanosensitive channel